MDDKQLIALIGRVDVETPGVPMAGLPRDDVKVGDYQARLLAIARAVQAAERERWMAAVSWALGTNGDFREQGTMEGRYWWRGELAERAGLRWDGAQWVDAGPNAAITGGHRPSGA